MNSHGNCPQRFGLSQKFNASVMVGLISMMVFILISSNFAYKITNDNLKLGTYDSKSDVIIPTTNGKWIHSVVAGLLALLLGFVVMEPWKKIMCDKNVKK